MDDEAIHIIRISTHTVEFFSRGCAMCWGRSGGLEPHGARIVSCQSWGEATAHRRWTRGGQGCCQPAEDGGTAGGDVGSPWGATSKGVGSLMRHDGQGHWQPREVRRASTGAATSKLALEVLATSRKVRSSPSVDGGAAMMWGQRVGTSTQLGDMQTVAARGAWHA